jgi:aryl-alcohol dehydrogenase-like predicted oxidoreductase
MPTDTEKSYAILRKALDLGIDHIDTSNVYGAGVSEERIGSFLKDQGVRKNDVFMIATKAGIKRGDDGRNYFDNSSDHLRSKLDKSLKRLGVEQVELFYIHRRDPNHPIEEVAGTLADRFRLLAKDWDTRLPHSLLRGFCIRGSIFCPSPARDRFLIWKNSQLALIYR